MIPEYSIKNIKGEDVLKVCDEIKNMTGVSVERSILDSIESGDLRSFADTLNMLNYLCFKLILALLAEKKALQSELNQFKN